MWKKMIERQTLIGGFSCLFASYAVSWLGVVYLGWRFDLFNLTRSPLDVSASIVAFTILFGNILVPIVCVAVEVGRLLPKSGEGTSPDIKLPQA